MSLVQLRPCTTTLVFGPGISSVHSESALDTSSWAEEKEPDLWPKSFFCNGWLLVNNAKASAPPDRVNPFSQPRAPAVMVLRKRCQSQRATSSRSMKSSNCAQLCCVVVKFGGSATRAIWGTRLTQFGWPWQILEILSSQPTSINRFVTWPKLCSSWGEGAFPIGAGNKAVLTLAVFLDLMKSLVSGTEPLDTGSLSFKRHLHCVACRVAKLFVTRFWRWAFRGQVVCKRDQPLGVTWPKEVLACFFKRLFVCFAKAGVVSPCFCQRFFNQSSKKYCVLL